jgi:hypothetical protein
MKYVVCWTWRKQRPVQYKYQGEHALKAWKWWYMRQGWIVKGNASRGYTASRRELEPMEWLTEMLKAWDGEPSDLVHSIGLRPYLIS